MISFVFLFAALSIKLEPGDSIYTKPAGTFEYGTIAPQFVPGATPASNACKRLDSHVAASLYSIREAIFQRCCWHLLNGSYGAPANYTSWNDLKSVDFCPSNSFYFVGTHNGEPEYEWGMTPTNSAWFPKTISFRSVFPDDMASHTNRIVRSPRVLARLKSDIDRVCGIFGAYEDASVTNDLSVPYFGYSINGRGTYLDPTVDHLALINGNWHEGGDVGMANMEAGFLRPMAAVKNDIATGGVGTGGVFTAYGGNVDFIWFRPDTFVWYPAKSMLDGYVDSNGQDIREGPCASDLVRAAAPAFADFSVEQIHNVAKLDSPRIIWQRAALAGAALSFASVWFLPEISPRLYVLSDINHIDFDGACIDELCDNPGGYMPYSEAKDISYDAHMWIDYISPTPIPFVADQGNAIYSVNATNKFGMSVLAAGFNIDMFGKNEDSVAATNSTSEARKIVYHSYTDFGWADDSASEAIKGLVFLLFRPEAFKQDSGWLDVDIPEGEYHSGKDFDVHIPPGISGDGDKIYLRMRSDSGSGVNFYKLDVEDAFCTGLVHVAASANGTGIIPLDYPAASIDCRECYRRWRAHDRVETNITAIGALPYGCPWNNHVREKALLNYSMFVGSKDGEFDFGASADGSKTTEMYTRLTVEDLPSLTASAFTRAQEKPRKTMISDLKTVEGKFLSSFCNNDDHIYSVFDAPEFDAQRDESRILSQVKKEIADHYCQIDGAAPAGFVGSASFSVVNGVKRWGSVNGDEKNTVLMVVLSYSFTEERNSIVNVRHSPKWRFDVRSSLFIRWDYPTFNSNDELLGFKKGQ